MRRLGGTRQGTSLYKEASDILDWQKLGLIPLSGIGTTTYDEGFELSKMGEMKIAQGTLAQASSWACKMVTLSEALINY